VEKTCLADSFFTYFSPPIDPKLEDDDDEIDKDKFSGLELKFEVDYQIDQNVKAKVCVIQLVPSI
jgi:hypothetical protein